MPAAKPTTSSRPWVESERSESVKRSPPTTSTITSTPWPPVSSFTASRKPSTRTVSSAPAAFATAAFSSVLTTAIVRAPYPFATWMLAVPTPPAAPWISTVSPAFSAPRSARANCAVR